MAEKYGKCVNKECPRAYRLERILADSSSFVCPECNSALDPVPYPPRPNWRNKLKVPLVGALVLLLLVGAGVLVYRLIIHEGGPVKTLEIAKKDSPPIDPKPTETHTRAPDEPQCVPQPLLMDGKKTLYQRVLTRPGAVLTQQAGGTGDGAAEPPFTRFYVYERRAIGGQEWLNVGANANCRKDGWLRAETTVEWKQQLTVAFDNPAGRDRVLFFEERTDLAEIIRSPNPAAAIDPILQTIQSGDRDERIVAIEPETYIDFTRKFYLLPILDFELVGGDDDRDPIRLLRVASINKDSDAASRERESSPPPNAAVVFVIDSTISMGPYIERTKEAVDQIYQRIRNSPLGRQVKFGLVAFRSNIRAVPDLEYEARLFADPSGVADEQDFRRQIRELRPARVSSIRFDEDSYAGVMLALESIDWNVFSGRFIVLITDAGALDASDPWSTTHKSADDLQKAAKDRDVVLYAFHLKTPEGRSTHEHAEGQYRTLTANVQNGASLYYSVRSGAVQNFGTQIDCLTNSLVHIVGAMAEPAAGERTIPPCPVVDENQRAETDIIREDAERVGHALRLEYLGRLHGTQAPTVVEGWIADHDVKQPVRPNVEGRVLLTRNELNNLALGVKGILDAAIADQSGATQLYRQLISLASSTLRDPNLAKRGENLTIAEMGILGEYLDGLPYKSSVMRLNQEKWESWSPAQQREFINSVTSKLERYAYYESDKERWEKLADHSDPGDEVYPVPLDALP